MAAKGLLVDAGPLVAILSKRDQHHAACVAEAKTLRGPFFTCWPVITEAAYLLRRRPAAVQKLLARVQSAKIRLLPLDASDAEPIADVLTRYSDQDLDLADAALMHLAAREEIDTVFTIDQRHFSIYRLPDSGALTIRPLPQ